MVTRITFSVLSIPLTIKDLVLNIVADYRSGNVIDNAVGNALDFTGTSWHSAQNGRQNFVIPNSVIQVTPAVLNDDGSVKTPAFIVQIQM